MTASNKIPTNNSIVDLKVEHNNLIDNQNKHGYYNLIANGDFGNFVDDTYETINAEL